MTFFETLTGGAPIEVYGGLAATDAYVNAKIGKGAAKYQKLIETGKHDSRKRLLIEATNYLERLDWKGARNGFDGTTLAWPRDGVTVGDVAIDPEIVPVSVVRAAFELVALFAATADAATAPNQNSNVKLIDADGTKIEFFGATTSADGTAPVLPHVVTQLIGKYLADPAPTVILLGGALGSSSGTDAESEFDDCDAYRVNGPL